VIHVLIACAKSTGRTVSAPESGCPEFQATLAPHNIEAWVEKTLAENGWYTHPDRDDYYCPAHNPTDQGVVMPVDHAYRPLGDSGWEARLPQGFLAGVEIEIRPRRWLTSADPEPGRDVVVEETDGTRWHRTDDDDRDGSANWEKVGVDYFEPETWTHVAGNCGPVRVAGDGTDES